MEPITQTILVKTISSAVSYSAQSLHKKIQSSIFDKKEIESTIFDNSYFDPLIEEYIESINEEVSKLDESLEINFDSICMFFKYPEIECIIRQIYAANLPYNSNREKNIKEIEKEFTLLLSKYFGVKEVSILSLSSLLFSILVQGCQETLDKQISDCEIAALAAMSNYHSKLIIDELHGIKENVRFLLKDEVDFKEIHNFFETYRILLKERHEYIPIANLEGNVRKHIDKIYVCPNFTKRSNETGNSKPLEFFEFLSKIHRVVLLGDPGNGKTTFTRKICYELSSRYSERLFAGREIIPFVVVIKDYHAEKKKNGISIIDFVNKELNDDFQGKTPNGFFEYLLLNGYILMIFDGLDELLDVAFREKVVNEIESFSTIYPSIPIIITSRRIGYEEAALREDMFEIYEMTSFNIAQIQEYVEKWFNLDSYLKPNERREKAKSFMIESERVSDLRSNSLMLSLMCNIYKQENYIPENRPKIYQACAEILFKKWDRRREINPGLTIQDSKIESLISYLAYWIYTNETSKGGVSEEELIRKATDYLYGSTYEDFDQAKMVARDFVKFSKGRAWILTDVGATKDQNLYQFTHRTFLEYFTAEWLCRKYEETTELANELIPKISKKEWDVVAQLAFQIRGEYSESATDKIFNTILKKAKESEEAERENLLSFAARSLEFMTPNPKIVKEITKDCFEFSLHLGKKAADKIKLRGFFRLHNSDIGIPIKPILDLKCSVRESRAKVVETLKSLIIENIKSDNKCEATLTAEIIFGLKRNLEIKTFFDKKEQFFWDELSDNILKECYENNEPFFNDDIHLCIQCYEVLFNSKIELILKLHGLEGIIFDSINVMSPDTRYHSIGQILLLPVTIPGYYPIVNKQSLSIDEEKKISEDLTKIGDFCLEYPLPINLKKKSSAYVGTRRSFLEDIVNVSRLIRHSSSYKETRLSKPFNYLGPTAIFGTFCLFAISLELNLSVTRKTELIEKKKRIKKYIEEIDIQPLNNIILLWLEGFDYIEIENELDTIGFTDRQKDFIKNWIKKNIFFLKMNNKV